MLKLHCKGTAGKVLALDDIIRRMILKVESEKATRELGERIGRLLNGGEVLQLVGDVGAGKTTFVKGLAKGLDVDEDVQSPSFTISRVYGARDNLQLFHYDFYRLSDPGIMANELEETVADSGSVTVIEWADIVSGVLPEKHFSIVFKSISETAREIEIPAELGLPQ